MDDLLLDRADRVLTLTLNRPQARNSLNTDLIAALVEALTAADSDPGVDVLVLTGADPVFCAGLDLRELEPGGSMDISALTHLGNPWPTLSKPLIGAINGAAVTGGLELALRCDILIASERARFGDSHARLGIMPFWGLTAALPAQVGLREALVMSLSGNFMSAERAHQLGLVAEVTAHADVLPRAQHLAADIASSDQAAVRAFLASYRSAVATDQASTLAAEQTAALAWQGSGFGAEEFAARRAAVTARGRTQK